MFFIINWLIASFLNGLLFFALFVFAFYWYYMKMMPDSRFPTNNQFDEPHIDPLLKEMMENGSTDMNESLVSLNLLFQFLFQELKDTKALRRYIINKLTQEFKELLNKKAASKILLGLTAREFNVGSSLPIIHSMKLHSYQMDKSKKSIQELSILVDLEYKNGFSVSIDADLILNKSAFMHLKIAHLKGKARLQFTRHPFTHWSFSFIDDPDIKFAASSYFEGKQMPHLTTLLLNQLRRSIKRKHTFPNYKCRFKPFFDPVYDHKLYKSELDEYIRKNEKNEFVVSSDLHTQDPSHSSVLRNDSDMPLNPALDAASNEAKIDTAKKFHKVESIEYRKLCEKIGFDLTSTGKLNVKLVKCDRLPDTIYTMNIANASSTQSQNQQLQQHPSQTSLTNGQQTANPLVKSASNNQIFQDNRCSVYLTSSIDQYSMKALMEKQVCTDYWPLVEVEFRRTSINQSLGISFVETFFVNKNEVVVQKIFPNSLGSRCKEFKVFDVVFSLNQVRITSLKQLNKTMQKAGVNLKFVFQRPCVQLSNKIHTSESFLNTMNTTVVVKSSDVVDQMKELKVDTQHIPSQQQLLQQTTPNSVAMSTPVFNTPSLTNVQTPIQQAPKTQTDTLSSSVSSHARSKFERLEQKLRLSFRSSKANENVNSTSASTTTTTNPVPICDSANNSVHATPSSLLTSNVHSGTTPTASILSTTPVNETLNPFTGLKSTKENAEKPSGVYASTSLVNHFSSASSLVSYFCNVSECSSNEPLETLDLISLLTNTGGKEEPSDLNANRLRKSSDIRVDKEKFFSQDNTTIKLDELFTFDLNSSTKYLNVFLWTVQHTNKMSRMRNVLIGYVSLPLNECLVDCWSVSKGESQFTTHFLPIDEPKASITKQNRTQFLMDHKGFDPNLTLGFVTLNLQHVLNKNENKCEKEQQREQAKLTQQVDQELVEHKKLEDEYKKKMREKLNEDEEDDDGSTHKFVTIQFNDSVNCEFCNKKIWFKNAYQCVYCGYVIHMKCYEKTIGKTICGRFYSQNETKNANENAASVENLDSYVIVSDKPARPPSPSQSSLQSNSSSNSSLLTSFLANMRHRNRTSATTNSQQSLNADSQSTDGLNRFSHEYNVLRRSLNTIKSANLMNSLNLLNSRLKSNSTNLANNLDKESKGSLNKKSPKPIRKPEQQRQQDAHVEQSSIGRNSDDSLMEFEDFRDSDQNEEKLFGTELFNELPVSERKQKFEERISRYKSTIDMMTKLKEELENDSTTNQNVASNQEATRAQIEHLEDQLKCVMFLLMQSQIGLESLIENENETTDENEKKNESFEPIHNASILKTIPVIQVDEPNHSI